MSVLVILTLLAALDAHSETVPVKGLIDGRIRVAAYNSEEIYRLHGYVGYQIDLQFEAGETFLGLGAGDIEALSFVPSDNHLFIKPKAGAVKTNLTVLTNRRSYQFDYTASIARHAGDDDDVIYSLRFTYPPAGAATLTPAAGVPNDPLESLTVDRPFNIDYWYCGSPSLKPVAASDDGVHTRLRFGARSEQPAIFVRNDDGTESLLNFSMADGDVIVHRVVHRLVVRRGRLTGCIVNKAFSGAGERLRSGTVSPDVERTIHGGQP